MRTRSRMLAGFAGAHLALSLAVGCLALWLVDGSLREQARQGAEAIAQLIAQGGFDPENPEVRAKIASLAGYEYRLVRSDAALDPGTVRRAVGDGLRAVEVSYLGAARERAIRAVVLGTALLVFGGTVAFGLVAWWLSRQLSRPIERLAESARRIGAGDLERAVPTVGSGEIVALARDLEHMRVRIRELDRQHRQDERLAAIGTFTATIAHEVRNPLSAVRLTVQLLAEQHGRDEATSMIIDEIERLDLIVDELLAFSTGMAVEPRPCDLRVVVDDTLRLMRRQAEHAGVTLSVAGGATLRADPARMRQLLMNLVLNAIQAQHGGGAVRILITGDGLVVEDDGRGVEPMLIERLFEPFATGRVGGTGLGLHLAWSIAQAHGAKLRYERDLATRFVLEGLDPA